MAVGGFETRPVIHEEKLSSFQASVFTFTGAVRSITNAG
jgi:hypothetical protein